MAAANQYNKKEEEENVFFRYTPIPKFIITPTPTSEFAPLHYRTSNAHLVQTEEHMHRYVRDSNSWHTHTHNVV